MYLSIYLRYMSPDWVDGWKGRQIDISVLSLLYKSVYVLLCIYAPIWSRDKQTDRTDSLKNLNQ